MIDSLPALAGLALSAFTSATVLPGTSEAVIVGLHAAGAAPAWMLFAVATVANLAGSVLNWLLGRGVLRLGGTRWIPVEPHQIERAQRWFDRWGRWSLLLAWLPVVGDPLTVAAGLMRVPFMTFLVLVGIAKAARYGVVLLAVAQF